MANKKKSAKKSIIGFNIITGLISGIGTFFVIGFVDRVSNYDDEIFIPLIIFSTILGLFLHTFIHELGHLLFGVMTGYKFSSFRIGSVMLIKSGEKLKLCKYKLAGTGGQCLLAPPENKEKKPYIMYNLGGIFLNIIFSVIFLVLIPLCNNVIVNVILAGFALGGILMATMNGVPTSAIDNDGSNTLAIGKDPYAVDAFYNQMKINYHISLGKSLKEIPAELFHLPENANLNNKIISAIAVQKCNILIDSLKIEEAYSAIQNLLNSDATLATIYYSLLKLECAYCELVGENRKNIVDSFLDMEVKKIIKSMRNNPSVVRFCYTYELFYNNNIPESDKFLAAFEKVAKTFPYDSLLDNERDLINYAQKKYAVALQNTKSINSI